uniref:hypothetical protein n=1 Tax=Agathobacter sp. TaxID=2021311 RepID=UPI004055D7F4
MLKQAFYTYTMSLSPKNLKDAKQKPDLWLWSVILLNSVYLEEGYRLQSFLFWFTILFPLMLMAWSNMNGKLPMPKAMFLAPMGSENRRQYIQAMVFVKIGVPVTIGLLFHILWGSIYGLNPLSIFASTIAHVSFGIGMYVCSELRVKRDRLVRYAVRDANGRIKTAWLNWVCMVFSLIMLLGFEANGLDGNMTQEDGRLFIDGLFLLLVLDIIIIKTKFHLMVEDICNYEIRFDVLS